MKKKLGLLLIPLLVLIDQLTKLYAKTYLQEHGPVTVIKGVFQFRYHTNSGAAWGMLEDRIWLFVLITLAALVLLGIIYFRLPAQRKFVPIQIILLFIVSGAVGNLIDRVSYHYVVDFLYLELIDFPIFNLADCYVTMSIAVLVILMIFKYKEADIDVLFSKKEQTDHKQELKDE
ncbi:signal peptidase II [Anaerolentibacter hominis]|uniref:signal peptidase II n=1 Tax=Anaerolentibacter hominis TaxID=3079009 RepID=UPI0031B8A050